MFKVKRFWLKSLDLRRKHQIFFLTMLLFSVMFVNFAASYKYDDFLGLKDNTDQCLVNCEAQILLKNPTAKPIQVDAGTLKFLFINNETAVD